MTIYSTRWWAAFAVALLLRSEFAQAESVDGFTEPYRTIKVAAADPGVVVTLHVHEGESVRQGQVLATLDVDFLEAARAVAQAAKDAMGRLESARAALELKSRRLRSLNELQSQGYAYEEEVRRAQAEADMARAEVLAAQEEQEVKVKEFLRIETQIERRNIRSPIDGIVTKLHKEVGEYVAATEPAVVTVVQVDRLRAIFPVPMAAASALRVGNRVRVTFSDGDAPADGTIEMVSPVADPETGTVSVKVVIENAAGSYHSGVACAMDAKAQRRKPSGKPRKSP